MGDSRNTTSRSKRFLHKLQSLFCLKTARSIQAKRPVSAVHNTLSEREIRVTRFTTAPLSVLGSIVSPIPLKGRPLHLLSSTWNSPTTWTVSCQPSVAQPPPHHLSAAASGPRTIPEFQAFPCIFRNIWCHRKAAQSLTASRSGRSRALLKHTCRTLLFSPSFCLILSC